MNTAHRRAVPILLILTIFIGRTELAVAQKPPQKSRRTGARSVPAPASTPVLASGLSIGEVIKMIEAKVPEPIIAAKVKKNATPFDLTPERKASASDAWVEVRMDTLKA